MQPKNKTSRRRFLAAGTGALSSLGLLSSAAVQPKQTAAGSYAVDDQVPFKGQTRRLKLTNGDRYITSLIFATDYPTHFRLKPELYPVCTPSGVPVTDSHQYCFIHHQSIMTGHGKVLVDGSSREVDFYRKLPYPDEDREDKFHVGKNLFHLGPSGIQKIVRATWDTSDRIVVKLKLEWQSRAELSEGGEPLVNEQRQYEVMQRGPYTIIDVFSQLVPAERPFTLIADGHSYSGVRVHDMIDPDEGGVMRDSEGRTNPDNEYWDQEGPRKAPRWIDCTGRIGRQMAGVTLISHPKNLRNEFYCRGWGLMICSAARGHDVRVTRKSPFQYATRFVAHDGEIANEAVEDLYREFSARKFPLGSNLKPD
jgi:hypothetical protein